MNAPRDSRLAPEPGRYPSASELPEVQADAAKQEMGDAGEGDMPGGGEMNPIMEALQTLQQYVMVAEQRGDQNAGALKEHLIEFVRTLAGTGEGEAQTGEQGPEPQGAPKPPMPPQEPQGEEPPQEGESAPPQPEGEMAPEQQQQPKRKLNRRIGVGSAVPMA
jgi:hypothetical protein